MIHTGFTFADILGAAVVLMGILFGFRQGLSGQMALVFSGLAVAAALMNGFEPFRDWLISRYAMPLELARMVALFCLVVVPVLIIMLLYSLLRYLFKITFTTWIDRLGGAIAGGLTSAGLVLLVFMMFSYLPENKQPEAVGQNSWISREVIGVETQLTQRLLLRVEKGETLIEKARAARAGKREKWEE
ncbi:MAG: CvpA family protein [bacterium]